MGGFLRSRFALKILAVISIVYKVDISQAKRRRVQKQGFAERAPYCFKSQRLTPLESPLAQGRGLKPCKRGASTMERRIIALAQARRVGGIKNKITRFCEIENESKEEFGKEIFLWRRR